MSAALWLGLRALAHHRGRALLLALATAFVAFVPIAITRFMGAVEAAALARADASPLVIGARGSRFDLVLSALWFRGRTPDLLRLDELERVRRDGLAEPVPLLVRHTAQGWPLVGTTSQYYRHRGLRLAEGELPLMLGECVLGATVAERLGLRTGDVLRSDPENALALDGAYPLRMRICGVLARCGTADDAAAFASLETTWILEGLMHGHGDARSQDQARVIRRDGERVVLDSGIVEYQEVTPENAASFHVHGERDALPLSAILALPRDVRSATLLLARYRVLDSVEAVVPRAVVLELLAWVLSLERVFVLQVVCVAIATAMLLALVLALVVRLRAREIETLARVGASRATVAAAFAVEFGAILLGGAVLALGLAWVTVSVLRSVLPWL